MRKLSVLLLAIALVAGACNNNKTKEKATIVSEDGNSKVTIDPPTTTAGQADEMNTKMEELKKLTPLTTEQLKSLLPEELMGMKRSNFHASSAMGWGTASGTYRNEGEDKEMRVTVIDCAGEAGSGIYTLNYWTKMSYESMDDNGYTKTVTLNGQKVVETYRKYNDEYELTYLSGDRLLVTVAGQKTGLDAVKQAASNLNLKTN